MYENCKKSFNTILPLRKSSQPTLFRKAVVSSVYNPLFLDLRYISPRSGLLNLLTSNVFHEAVNFTTKTTTKNIAKPPIPLFKVAR